LRDTLFNSLLQTPERQKDDWPPHNARLSWALKVSIPVNAHISAFTTDMSIFVHHLNLEGLNLNNLTLRTSNAPVQLEVRMLYLALNLPFDSPFS
jgi:hypothetical protein